jgi:hypothetical protein
MSSILNRRPARNRYLVVYDAVNEDDKIYGIMKLGTKGIKTSIELQFFNDEGRIDLSFREVSPIEWETMKAFELFPILTPYYREPVIYPAEMWPHPLQPRDKHTVTIFKVRFRDY